MAEEARQLTLGLPPPPRDETAASLRTGFAETPATEDALALLAASADWPRGVACLVGPRGAGKSHIAAMAAPEARTIDGPAATARLARHGGVEAGAAYRLEDVDRLLAAEAARPDAARRTAEIVGVADGAGSRAFEIALFHVLNQIAEAGARLLLTARTAPARWPVSLPDLATRLNAAPIARIAPPDEALLAAILERRAGALGLGVSPAALAFAVLRIERSFEAVADLAEHLDAVAFERRAGEVTRPLVAAALARMAGDDVAPTGASVSSEDESASLTDHSSNFGNAQPVTFEPGGARAPRDATRGP